VGPDEQVKPRLSQVLTTYKRCTLCLELETYCVDLKLFTITSHPLKTQNLKETNHIRDKIPIIDRSRLVIETSLFIKISTFLYVYIFFLIRVKMKLYSR
jgi:hypothetical protein